MGVTPPKVRWPSVVPTVLRPASRSVGARNAEGARKGMLDFKDWTGADGEEGTDNGRWVAGVRVERAMQAVVRQGSNEQPEPAASKRQEARMNQSR